MALRSGTLMPSLAGASEWVTREVSAQELEGHLTVIHFWSISCPLCKVNMPTLVKWRQTYVQRGLCLVAVHTPRTAADADLHLVRAAVAEWGITEPCAVDNDWAIGHKFQVDAWPYYFLFDREARLRSRSAGGVGLKLAECSLGRLLVEPHHTEA